MLEVMRYLIKDITMTKNGYYRVWIGLRLING